MPSTGYIRCQCGKEMNKNSLYKHRRDAHSGNEVSYELLSGTTETYTIREGHPDSEKEYFEKPVNSYDKPVNFYEKPVNSYEKSYEIYYDKPEYFEKNENPDINKRLVEIINNFNGHIKKIYAEKADKTCLYTLQNQVSHMKADIQGMRRTLTEKSMIIDNISNAYRHRKHVRQIDNVVHQKAGNVKTDIVLENVKQNIEVNKQSIDKTYELIQLFTDRIDRLEGDMKVIKEQVTSIDNSNNILIQNSKRHQKEIDELKKKPSKNDVINLIYLILDRSNVNVNKTMIKELLSGQIETNEKIKNTNIKKFSEEMNDLISKMRLTKKDELNKTTLKTMKNIIEKHSQGNLDEIKNYMESLPKTKSKINKKKAVMRKHLSSILEN